MSHWSRPSHWKACSSQVTRSGDSPAGTGVHYVSALPMRHPTVKDCLHLPVTTCEYERSILNLGQIKSALRSTMGELHLNRLAMLHVHYSQRLDLDKVVQLFMYHNSRRIVAPNLDLGKAHVKKIHKQAFRNFFSFTYFHPITCALPLSLSNIGTE